MITFFTSVHCGQGQNAARCTACREDRSFRANLVESFHDVREVDFECPHTSEGARGTQPLISRRLRTMGVDELIREARAAGPSKRIQSYIDYIASKRYEESRCPGCARSRVARLLREWLAKEEARHGS